MGKIGLIIQREFNERVRKRSFIISTILTPLLFLGIAAAAGAMAVMQVMSADVKKIAVIDPSGIVMQNISDSRLMVFEKSEASLEQIKQEKTDGLHEDLYGVLVIGEDVMTNPRSVQLYTYKASTVEVEGYISKQVEGAIEAEKLKSYDIEGLPEILAEIKTSISLTAYKIEDSGEEKESSSATAIVMAYIFGFMIYMFVFTYGAMVMQGVIEEKNSKVLEIMVSSLKPFQLMMGKIIGIAAVAITQLLIWMVLILVGGSVALHFLAGGVDVDAIAAAEGMASMGGGMSGLDPELISSIRTVTDVGFLLRVFGGFLVYFIGGYLLYAAMYAAVGSAVDNAADAQQLQIPITIPMILGMIVMMGVMQDPNSSMAVWFSIIPFTSPIVMAARIPYGVPLWEIVTSIVVLYASFMFMVWFAGKIYRVGIFMTGKKPTLREVIKWSRYKY